MVSCHVSHKTGAATPWQSKVTKAEHCVIGGGEFQDKALACTNYWYDDPSISQYPTGVVNITEKQPGDNNAFIVDKFESWLECNV